MSDLAVGGRLVVNLTQLENDRIGRALQAICSAPAGADVVVIVAPRQFVPYESEYVREFGRHIGRLTIECSDPETITNWTTCLREGHPQW